MDHRYHYFRAHSHPFGWGVRDSKTNAVVAMGDKSTCAHLALLFNGQPSSFKFDTFAEDWDSYHGAHNSANVYEYNDDGTLRPFKAAERLKQHK